jgi:hypothetical protein
MIIFTKNKYMKRSLFFALFAVGVYTTGQAQNVGINTSNPLAALHVVDSSVVFTANGQVSEVPGPLAIQGEGRRMMWYAGKGSFRTGYVVDTNWNRQNIGYYSFGAGYNVMAFGTNSIAFGANTKALGNFSTAFGSGSSACASYATAFGLTTKASGDYSTALGGSTLASGLYSTAFGNSSTASGYISTAFGLFTNASGWGATAFGNYTSAASNYSSAFGNNTVAKGFSGTVVGMYNDSLLIASQMTVTDNTPLFVVGNGNSNEVRSNALTVRKNGDVQFKGIIRNGDGTMSKKLSATAVVNASFTAGETKTFAINWPSAFAGAPEAYVGNIVNAGTGFSDVIMYIYNATATGATLYVRNTTGGTITPNFSVKLIAIGGE